MLHGAYVRKNVFEYMDVSLSYTNHRHVSATHADIFRVARKRILP